MKNILIGVTGGIAAYKTANIISMLKKKNYEVKVVMTENATKIISPLTLETLSKNTVYVDMWHKNSHYEVEHISLAAWADLVLIAPTTYNVIGKIANGIADDLLTTIISATKAPVFFALAMNTNMYDNPILKENILKLKKFNYNFIDADVGLLACNYVGKGKMLDEISIVSEIERYQYYKNKQFVSEILKGKKILITSGRTREDIDPVRYITNNSSGKMGYSLAQAAADFGANVTLLSGLADIEPPKNIENFEKVSSATQLYEKVKNYFQDCDIFISCAAVADYRPKNYSESKIKKQDGNLVIELTRNPDILFEMGKIKDKKLLVGFAAETDNIKENAINKLIKKNLDLIVANNATVMSKDSNSVTIFKKDKSYIEILEKSKLELAYDIIEVISEELKRNY